MADRDAVLRKRGHEVHVVDNYLRRRAHQEAGTDSLTPIAAGLPDRVAAWKDVTGQEIGFTEGDLTDWDVTERCSASSSPRRSCTTARCPARPTR